MLCHMVQRIVCDLRRVFDRDGDNCDLVRAPCG